MLQAQGLVILELPVALQLNDLGLQRECVASREPLRTLSSQRKPWGGRATRQPDKSEAAASAEGIVLVASIPSLQLFLVVPRK